MRRLRWRKEFRVTVCVVLVVAGSAFAVGCGSASRTVPGKPSATTTVQVKPVDSLVTLVAKARSGVVKIEVDACGIQEIGTGFLVGSRLVATVEHVVGGASSITLKQGGKTVATGTVIGQDSARDVALIRASSPIRGTVLRLAPRAPQLGESVAGLGFPFALPLTVTKGSVSGLGRTVPINGVNRRQMVQTDAAVNEGNSGGPLISIENGDVIGLVDLGTHRANGIGFAVSAQVAEPLLQAWQTAPQPVSGSSCDSGTSSGPQATVPPPPSPTPQVPTPQVPTPSAPSDEQVVLDVVNQHWENIKNHNFSAAYQDLGPNLASGESSWVSGQEAAGITGVSYQFSVAWVNGDNARVDIVQLQTQDAQSGCSNWTGHYGMARIAGSWLINIVALQQQAC